MNRYLISLFILVGLVVLSGCSSVGGGTFFEPVTPSVTGVLDANQGHELSVWSKNHATIFDFRLHSLETCPFLSYTPGYLVLGNSDLKRWAEFLYKFYGRKHLEERDSWMAIFSSGYHCKCDKILGK